MAILNSTTVNGQLDANALHVTGQSGSMALYVSGNASVNGDLEVKGNLVYVGTKEVQVEDKTIEIAYRSGSVISRANADGAGVLVGNSGSIASITYKYAGDGKDASEDRIVPSHKISGSITDADHATAAGKVDNALVFGDGITADKTSYDGHEAVTISIETGSFKPDTAKHADSASKVDHQLRLTGDGLAADVVFDGSATATASFDLSAYETVEAHTQYSASQATVNANILLSASNSASAAESASKAYSSASLASYSASQATVNVNLEASASKSLADAKEYTDGRVAGAMASASADLNAYTASNDIRVSALEVATGSQSGRLDSLEAKSGSWDTAKEEAIASASSSLGIYSASQADINTSLSASIAVLDSGSSAALAIYSASVAPTIIKVQSSSASWDAAQANVLEGVKVNGSDLEITDKKVDILIVSGTANGTIKVNGVDVEVHGLGSAAYTDATAYDAAGDAEAAALRAIATASVDATDKSEAAAVRAIASASIDATSKIEALDASYESQSGKYIASIVQTDGIVTASFADLPATAIATGEKILSRNASDELQTTLSITFDTGSTKVQLIGISGSVISEFDASAFVKDSMLLGQKTFTATATSESVTITRTIEGKEYSVSKTFENLTVGNQYIAMCFIAVDPSAETGYKAEWSLINASELIKPYTAGTAVEISGSIISVKNAEGLTITGSYDAGKNFIEVTDDNELIVKGVDADCTETVKSVEVNGGPLASLTTNWPWQEGGKNVVPANLSMQDFIEGLFLKVMNGTVTKGSPSWNPTVSQPSTTLSLSGDQEVGTTVTVSFATTNTVDNNTRSITISNNGYGEFVGSGAWQAGSYTQTKVGTTTGSSTITSAKWNNSEITESGVTRTIVEGTNKLEATQSGIVASVEKFDDITVYASTNTKVKLTEVTASISEAAAPETKTLTNKNQATVTGKRAYWVGFLANAVDETKLNSEGIRNYAGLTKSFNDVYNGWSTTPSTTFRGLIIVTDKTLQKLQNAGGDDLISGCTKTSISIEGANGYAAKTYNLYYCSWAAPNAAEKWTIVC